MPTGKRASNKVHVGCYIDKEVREMVKEILKSQNITTTDYLYYCLLKLLNKSADEIIKELKSSDGRTVEGKARNNKRFSQNDENGVEKNGNK